jgi:hypothetical protein
MRRADLADLTAFVAVADNLSFRASVVAYLRQIAGRSERI